MRPLYIRLAILDILKGIKQADLAAFMAWEDIRQRYVRTLLGPLWIVLSTGVWFAVMGYVMANLFHQNVRDYLPYVMSGLLIWNLITSSVSESSQVLVASAPLITSFSIPIFTHYIRFILRNYIIFLHNLIILIIVFCLFPPAFTASTWLVLPGLVIDLIILTGLAVLLSLTNLRYRDTHLAVGSAMQVLAYVTPIFWNRNMLKENTWIADINPFTHMLNIVRAPMLGESPPDLSWAVTVSLAVTLSLMGSLLFIRYRHRIIFWL